MRRASLLAFAALAAACAQPLVRPAMAPVPADASSPPGLPSGPNGESPPLTGPAPISRAVPTVVLMSDAHARDIIALRAHHLVIPVAGVGPDKIEDSFTADRDGGERQHNAVDILAPRNTPVVAADDGTILRMSSNKLGGITIFATDANREFVYYYAHLDHYDPRVHEHQKVQKGDTIGYVGTTGNAPKNVPHLHFQIMKWPDDGKYWIGDPINPYPVLHQPR